METCLLRLGPAELGWGCTCRLGHCMGKGSRVRLVPVTQPQLAIHAGAPSRILCKFLLKSPGPRCPRPEFPSLGALLIPEIVVGKSGVWSLESMLEAFMVSDCLPAGLQGIHRLDLAGEAATPP